MLSALSSSGQFPFSIVRECAWTFRVRHNASYRRCSSKNKFSSTNGYDPHAPSSYVQSYNLTVERALPKGLAVELAYSGSKGTHLGRQIDINQERPRLLGPAHRLGL